MPRCGSALSIPSIEDSSRQIAMTMMSPGRARAEVGTFQRLAIADHEKEMIVSLCT